MHKRTAVSCICLVLLTAACARPSDPAPAGTAGQIVDAEDVMVLVAPPSDASMTALLAGELKHVGGCLGVGETVVIWPHGTSVESTEPVVISIPGDGNARLGHTVEIGGGEIRGPGESAPAEVAGMTLPASCAGHAVWLAGPGGA